MTSLISTDILKFVLLPSVNLATLFRLCQTNSFLSNNCNNELLWKQKIFTEYQIETKPRLLTWRQFAFQLTFNPNNVRSIEIKYLKQPIGKIWITNDETIEQIKKDIVIFANTYFNRKIYNINGLIYMSLDNRLYHLYLSGPPTNIPINKLKLEGDLLPINYKIPFYLGHVNFYIDITELI